jgi:Zn-dependent oligopeptidase
MLEQCFICIEEQKIAKQFEQSGLELKRERNKEWMKIESEINEETSQHDEETTSNNDVKISEK